MKFYLRDLFWLILAICFGLATFVWGERRGKRNALDESKRYELLLHEETRKELQEALNRLAERYPQELVPPPPELKHR